jgi:toxin-antitoxin system PIN domain toxin
MMLLDTNVLIYAHRPDARRHAEYRDWVRALVNGPQPYAVTDVALTGMIRIVTNPRIYRVDPTPTELAIGFANVIRTQPHARVVGPGGRFWEIFTELCRDAKACGDLISDVYLAAVAIENGCEVVSEDSDFDKFPGLRWSRPLF